MSIYAARQFLRIAKTDKKLRTNLNGCMTVSELNNILEAHQLLFSAADLEEAWYKGLTHCQTESEALKMREIVIWFQMLVTHLQEEK